ncbi:hypothetical protein EON64_07960 [archaeon]|nr:MAG: hypothetical protein EON64_07960 [archaeon]
MLFAFEPSRDSIMAQKPRKVDKHIFGRFLIWRVAYVSALLVIAVLVNFQWEKQHMSSLNKLRTAAVNTLCAGQVGYVFNCRNLRKNVGIMRMFTGNLMIYGGIVLVCALQMLFTYAPPFQYVFETEPLDAKSWGKIVCWSVFIFVMVELEKWVGGLLRRDVSESNEEQDEKQEEEKR